MPSPKIVRLAAIVLSVPLLSCKSEAPRKTDPVVGTGSVATAGAGPSATALHSKQEGDPCLRHDECEAGGQCEEAACVSAATIQCREDASCGALGLCTARGDDCIAGSEQACQSSSNCRLVGQCQWSKDKCVVGAKSDEECNQGYGDLQINPCEIEGRCTAVHGRCIATSDQQCATTDGCSDLGHCSAKDGTCQVGKDEDCKGSAQCAAEGRCKARDILCVPGSAEDCKRSKACKDRGLCTFAAEPMGQCIAGT